MVDCGRLQQARQAAVVTSGTTNIHTKPRPPASRRHTLARSGETGHGSRTNVQGCPRRLQIPPHTCSLYPQNLQHECVCMSIQRYLSDGAHLLFLRSRGHPPQACPGRGQHRPPPLALQRVSSGPQGCTDRGTIITAY